MELVDGIRSIDGLCLGLCCCDIGQMVDFSRDYIFGIGISGGKLRSRKDATKVVAFEVAKEGGDAKQGLARDHWQVLANGGIFMLLAMLAF